MTQGNARRTVRVARTELGPMNGARRDPFEVCIGAILTQMRHGPVGRALYKHEDGGFRRRRDNTPTNMFSAETSLPSITIKGASAQSILPLPAEEFAADREHGIRDLPEARTMLLELPGSFETADPFFFSARKPGVVAMPIPPVFSPSRSVDETFDMKSYGCISRMCSIPILCFSTNSCAHLPNRSGNRRRNRVRVLPRVCIYGRTLL